MTTLHKEVLISAPPAQVWDAIRDLGAVHKRLTPGLVVDTKLDGDVRTLKFANGMTLREPILSVDDSRRRLAWSAEGANLTHYNAVMEVHDERAGCRVTWTSDLLPSEASNPLAEMQDQALALMKKTLEGARS